MAPSSMTPCGTTLGGTVPCIGGPAPVGEEARYIRHANKGCAGEANPAGKAEAERLRQIG